MDTSITISDRAKPAGETKLLTVGALIFPRMDQIDFTGPFEDLMSHEAMLSLIRNHFTAGIGESILSRAMTREKVHYMNKISIQDCQSFTHLQVFGRGLGNKCVAHVFCPMDAECDRR